MIYVPDEHKYSIYYNDINGNIKIPKKKIKRLNEIPHGAALHGVARHGVALLGAALHGLS